MLGNWRTHGEYQSYLLEKILPLFESDRKNVLHYKNALSKLYILDLDTLKPLLAGYYSITGTPAKNQPELIRSFILMSMENSNEEPHYLRKSKQTYSERLWP